MTPAAPRFLSAASSDQGVVRANNEDRVYVDEVRGVFLVVDGMGGHEAGEEAARIAVERIRARLERQTGSIEQRIREAITLANNAIFEAAQTQPDWAGMACVLTLAVIEDSQVNVGHVGDSRLYRIKRRAIQKLTHDHSPVGELEDSGSLAEAEAMQHPRRNEVYRDVGSRERTPDDEEFIEIVRFPLEPDSALLLCSDGLSDALPSRDILQIVERNAGDRWATVRNLIAAANQIGKDNVSAVLVEGDRFAASLGRPAPSARRPEIPEPEVTGERTGRLASAPRPTPWYFGRRAYLVYGAILGALAVFAALKYFPAAEPPHVPQTLAVSPPNTIASALEKAQPGDTVSAAPGTYIENVRLKDGVDLVSQQPHEAIIQGEVSAADLRRARFEGFRIRAVDVGISVRDSDVTFIRDEITGARIAAIEIGGTSRGAVVACSIRDNAGAGIIVRGSSAPSIEKKVIASNGAQPSALQLRYLQTLTEIAVEKNSTIVFPLPIDLIQPLLESMHRQNGATSKEPFDGPRHPVTLPPRS